MKNAGLSQLILGMHHEAYEDNRFRKSDSKMKDISLKLLGCAPNVAEDTKINAILTEMVADGVHLARDLVGAPSNVKTPLLIADQARKIAEEHNLECKILGLDECQALGMGGYLSVQQGFY